jgi:hypothetical protein
VPLLARGLCSKWSQKPQLPNLIANGVVNGTAQALHDALQQRLQYITEPEGMFWYAKTRNGTTMHLNQRQQKTD